MLPIALPDVSPEAVKSDRCVWEVDRTLELSKVWHLPRSRKPLRSRRSRPYDSLMDVEAAKFFQKDRLPVMNRWPKNLNEALSDRRHHLTYSQAATSL